MDSLTNGFTFPSTVIFGDICSMKFFTQSLTVHVSSVEILPVSGWVNDDAIQNVIFPE